MAAQRALIVENEPLIAIDLEATLRALGLDVCGLASNPREAVELATSRRPDLVLMDVYLEEGLQGIKAAKCCGTLATSRCCSSPATAIRTLSPAFAKRCPRFTCAPSPSLRSDWRKPLPVQPVGRGQVARPLHWPEMKRSPVLVGPGFRVGLRLTAQGYAASLRPSPQ
jgi:hypothetical protein